MSKVSRIPGFYKKTLAERVALVGDWAGLNEQERAALLGQGLPGETAAQMVENGLGTYELPIGLACNFTINGRDYLIPMAIEEPSVIAAVSFAAKLVREGGGFQTEASAPVMIGQIQVLDLPDLGAAQVAIEANEAQLMAAADAISQNIVRRGGGARGIEVRAFPQTPAGPMLVVHLLYDCRDAMGANAINTAVEALAPLIEDLSGGRTNLRILSNLTDRRTGHRPLHHSSRCSGNARLQRRGGREGYRRSQYLCHGRPVSGHDPQQGYHERRRRGLHRHRQRLAGPLKRAPTLMQPGMANIGL